MQHSPEETNIVDILYIRFSFSFCLNSFILIWMQIKSKSLLPSYDVTEDLSF